MCVEVMSHADEVMGDPMCSQRQQCWQAEQDEAGKGMGKLALQMCRVVADLLTESWQVVHIHCVCTQDAQLLSTGMVFPEGLH